MRSPVRTRLALAGAAALIALTGCGADLHPGAAAVVGPDRVTLEEADDFAERFCDLNRPALAQNSSTVSMAEVRSVSLQIQVRDLLVRRYVEEHDVDPDAQFRTAVSGLDAEMERFGIAEENVETFVQFRRMEEYARAVLLAIGERERPGVAPEEALQAGSELFAEWEAEQDVEIDPRFGRTDPQTGFQPGGEPLSVAVSPLAVLGSTPRDPEGTGSEYAEALPASQTCG